MIGFQVKRVLKFGAKSLWMHKLRSGLTMLGIMFGVCSVIAMLAIGTGASQQAQEQIKRLGSHNIIIDSVKPPTSQQTSTSTTQVLSYGLTYKDYDLISSTVPYVQLVAPARKVRGTLINGGSRMDTDTVGVTPDYISVNNMTVLEGRFITQEDMDYRSPVCVLGKSAADSLFPLGDGLNSIVRGGPLRFRVVGIVTSVPRGELGGQSAGATDPNTQVYIPFSTMRTVYGATNVVRSSGSMSAERVELHELIVQVSTLDAVQPVEQVIRHVLKMSHAKDDYQVIVPLQLLVQARRTALLWSFVLSMPHSLTSDLRASPRFPRTWRIPSATCCWPQCWSVCLREYLEAFWFTWASAFGPTGVPCPISKPRLWMSASVWEGRGSFKAWE